ncbi:uncharacterized protein I303_101532 [Kwoniella dejecticola CBS 10117]|uniref:Zinc finger Mcm10/DnaG-type domain-containing protein n=1 Tax=Kwoniella dejecticola CBS 10117 TaxID=1296121 RepID=A0A1A6ADG9_9TREE|nr:uncharacterized protein I303_02336 [Kwoniella dejecticola CBS 10117]OBR88117.1 hypothetical protein I303_02336 [Kwoniella dejecticola CBS 10117]
MDSEIDDIDAEIAALQKRKEERLAKVEKARRAQEKEQAKVLVGSTPTKTSLKAAQKGGVPLPSRPAQPNFDYASSSRIASSSSSTLNSKPSTQALPELRRSEPSRMGSSLAARRKFISSSSGSNSSREPSKPIIRSNGFEERKKPSPLPSLHASTSGRKDKGKAMESSPELEVEDPKDQVQRDEDNLTIIEKLELGPKEFGLDPEGGDEWNFVEPNSGIRLTKRALSHSHLQDHLSGRYHLNPSQIYSVIRLSKDGATYDIPVDGDWITIAVVAQRGEIKISGTKNASEYSDDDEDGDEGMIDEEHDSKSLAEALKVNPNPYEKGEYTQSKKPRQPWKKSKKDKDKLERKRIPRKYINYTLCAMPPRRAGRPDVAGDALLHLLLFEADAVVREEDADGKVNRSYHGGSGGAYEKWCNLTEGNVIAILNPRVWRNLRGGSNGPHPLEFPLGLNPHSADSIILLGQAKDLGRCSALQKDGNRCKTWVDLRQSQVCEYHIHAAVQRGKSSRAEFTASTSSFALTSRPNNLQSSKGKIGFDPKKKTGLLPAAGRQAAPRGQDNGGGGATYVVGGGVINTGSVSRGGLKGYGEEHLSEKLGRNRAEKRKRQMEERHAERALQDLLAREGQSGSTGAKYLSILEKDRLRLQSNKKAKKKDDDDVLLEKKRPFGAEAIKRIGFDPTSRTRIRDDEDVQKRLDALSALRGEEPGCRLERLSKRLEEEAKAKAKALKEKIKVEKAAEQEQVDDFESGEEDMIDLD